MLFAIGFVAGLIAAIVAHPFILSWQASQLQGLPQDIDPDIWEEAEVVTNVTVQILRNSRTGEYSVGWCAWDEARNSEVPQEKENDEVADETN